MVKAELLDPELVSDILRDVAAAYLGYTESLALFRSECEKYATMAEVAAQRERERIAREAKRIFNPATGFYDDPDDPDDPDDLRMNAING